MYVLKNITDNFEMTVDTSKDLFKIIRSLEEHQKYYRVEVDSKLTRPSHYGWDTEIEYKYWRLE